MYLSIDKALFSLVSSSAPPGVQTRACDAAERASLLRFHPSELLPHAGVFQCLAAVELWFCFHQKETFGLLLLDCMEEVSAGC